MGNFYASHVFKVYILSCVFFIPKIPLIEKSVFCYVRNKWYNISGNTEKSFILRFNQTVSMNTDIMKLFFILIEARNERNREDVSKTD